MSWIKRTIAAQMVDQSNVEPWCRFDVKKNRFYLNSCAGIIEFRAKKSADIPRFRDAWINRFEAIKSSEKIDNSDFYNLYNEILANEKNVKYTANIRTRLKCSLSHFT